MSAVLQILVDQHYKHGFVTDNEADVAPKGLNQGLSCDHVELLGDDGEHFEALIVSPQFTGKNRVQQHQLVYLALGDRMRSESNALAMRTFAPDAWAQSLSKYLWRNER